MMSKMLAGICVECRESEDAIWIGIPGNDEKEDYLCENCFDKLNVRSGAVNVKGSQYKPELHG
jgi:protein-arginine kinase activator protein McsA